MVATTGFTVAPEIRPLLPLGSDVWRLVIIGDRFEPDHRNAFFAYCQDFANYLVDQAPFRDPDIRPRIQVYACFTPTTVRGMFKCRRELERRIYGQPELVRKYLKRHRDAHPELERRRNDLILVLMNFMERGGAGEQGDDNIAWTTPIPWLSSTRAIIEPWKAVALHELGHAFNLDDEYEAAWPDAPDTPTKANVSAFDSPDQAPWKALFGALSPVELRSIGRDLGSVNPDHPTAAELATYGNVEAGMFQGARYSSEKFWRSALRCKMRCTTQPFCKACQEVIRTSVLTNG